jgi:probable phosphoglycerate mutase
MAEPSRPPSLVPLNEMFLADSPDAAEILLVRHGQQELISTPGASRAERTDPPLSAIGRRQAKVVAAALASEAITAVYTSTLSRARDTGAAIAAHHDLKAQEVVGIEEIGLFRHLAADLPVDAMANPVNDAQFRAGASAYFMRERRWDVYPLSESSADFRRRVVTGIEGVVAAHPGERVVVACHGGVINTYLGWILGLPQDMWFLPAHASVSRFRAHGTQRALVAVNDRTHLSAADPSLVTHDATG